MQVLPHILSDRRQRLQLHEETVVQDSTQQMNIAVQQLFVCVAELRQSSNVIEGSVLVLGVPTTHTLLTQLGHSTQAMQSVLEAWRSTAAVQMEHVAQYRLLITSMDQAYTALRERRDAVEKELRVLRSERDRKDAAFDKAVGYVQHVVAEHTKWQEACGFNTQLWPVVDACEDALTALHNARVSVTGNVSAQSRQLDTTSDSGCSIGASVVARLSAGKSKLSPSLPPREWAPVHVESSEVGVDVAQRWSSTAARRQGTTNPAVRFAYIPPAEEVRLLRSVLAMGTGSTTLMKDIQDERARLVAARATVRAECAKYTTVLQSLRTDLTALRQHLTSLVESHAPFLPMSADLLRSLRSCIEAEVVRRCANATGSLYRTARASSAEFSTAEFRISLPMHNGLGDEEAKGWLAEV